MYETPSFDPRLYNAIAVGGAAILVALEMRSERFREVSFFDKLRASRNWAFFVAAVGVMILLRKVSEGAHELFPSLFDWGHHVTLNLVGCFLVAEFFGWALHYIKHAVPFLWRFHFQHHREENYNIWMVTHTHALEVLVSGTLTAISLQLLGFSPFSVQVYLLFYSLANTYQHSEFSYSLGWLDKIIVNPSYHSFHHAVGSQVNYGNTLTVWDVIFRTARFPRTDAKRAVRCGIVDGGEPFGFWGEMLWFLRRDEGKVTERAPALADGHPASAPIVSPAVLTTRSTAPVTSAAVPAEKRAARPRRTSASSSGEHFGLAV